MPFPAAGSSAPQDDSAAPQGRATLTLAAALVTVVLWASAFIGIRGAGPHFDPGSLALLRMVIGAAALVHRAELVP